MAGSVAVTAFDADNGNVPLSNVKISCGGQNQWTVDSGWATIVGLAPNLYYDVTASKTGKLTQTKNVYVADYEATHVDFFMSATPPPPSVSLVTVSVAGQGSTDPTVGEHVYTLGSNLYVVGTAAAGWHCLKMRRNGADWTTANPGEFLNLAATESIEVVFEQDTTPPPNGGGEPRPTWLYVAVPVGVLFAVVLGYYVLKKKR